MIAFAGPGPTKEMLSLASTSTTPVLCVLDVGDGEALIMFNPTSAPAPRTLAYYVSTIDGHNPELAKRVRAAIGGLYA